MNKAIDLSLRAATQTERLYAFDQNVRIAGQCGSPGYLFGELDKTLSVFFHNWMQNDANENTPEFKAEFKAVLDMLRFDEQYGGILENRTAMTVYCHDHPEGRFHDGRDYAFRADTKDYAYLIRCIPDGDDDNHVYIHPYRRECLEHHMKQAEKGIRFITPQRKEKFRVPDGERIQITTSGAGTRVNTVRYVDDYYFELVTDRGSYLYHIHEFAKWLERHDGKVIPLRSTLPDKCYSVLPNGDEIITIKKGEDGYYHTDKYGHDRQAAQAIVDEYNGQLGVSKAQEAAMLAGSVFGWHVPGADPKNYDEQGHLIKHRDRRDAR